MTRQAGKSVKLSAIVALLVLMVVGIDEIFAENQAQIDLHEFEKLLDGVGTTISPIHTNVEPTVDTSQTMYASYIASQISYLEAFDEVIRKQFL